MKDTEWMRAPVTQIYELIDKDGRTCGTYPTATAAGESAKRCWPSEQQDPDHTGIGRDIQVVGS